MEQNNTNTFEFQISREARATPDDFTEIKVFVNNGFLYTCDPDGSFRPIITNAYDRVRLAQWNTNFSKEFVETYADSEKAD